MIHIHTAPEHLCEKKDEGYEENGRQSRMGEYIDTKRVLDALSLLCK